MMPKDLSISLYSRFRMKRYFRRAAPYVPGLREVIHHDGRFKNIIQTLTNQLLSQYKVLPPEWYLPPFKDREISNVSDLWRLNNFIEKSSLIKVPTLIWNTQNDSIIKYDENGKALKAKNQNPNITILGTKYGEHCLYSSAFGWGLISRLLKSYILSNSPEFSVEKNIMPIEFNLPTLPKGEIHTVQEWSASKNNPNLTLTFPTDKKYSYSFNFPNLPFWSNKKIRTPKQIPYKLLPFTIAVPKSDAEAQALTRWLNTNVELLTSNKTRLQGTSEIPMYIQWHTP